MKKYNTLVLNRHYIPIHMILWKKTMSLIYQDVAHALDQDFVSYNYHDWIKNSQMSHFPQDDYIFIPTVNYRVPVPDIIVLTKYDKLPKRDVKYSRQNIFARDKHICAYCGKRFNQKDLTIDHILPKALGGQTTWNNVISACKRCNQQKADKTLKQANLKLKYKPKEPLWYSALAETVQNVHVRPNWAKFLKAIDVHIDEEKMQ